jgi:hypothetical protein
VLTRYHYDPMSRRVGKQHLKLVPAEQPGAKPLLSIQSSLWYGWDGDRMVTMQNERQASTTIYEPNSLAPRRLVWNLTSEAAVNYHVVFGQCPLHRLTWQVLELAHRA